MMSLIIYNNKVWSALKKGTPNCLIFGLNFRKMKDFTK